MKSSLSEKFSYHWLLQKPLKMPIDKTRLSLIYLLANFLIVFLDVAIAHAQNRFLPVYEWIPVIYSPLAALAVLLLLISPLPGWNKWCYMLLMATGMLIGTLGFGFHLQGAAAGNTVSYEGLINGNPVFAPLAFIALGAIGVITGLDDRPSIRKYDMTQKTRWLLIVTGFWFLATATVAFFDHARTGFTNMYTWIPVYEGIFAGSIIILQAYSKPTRGLSILLGLTVALSVIVGLLGFAFHLSTDLAGRGAIVWARVFYQAPGLAPLLFADLGIWGALVFLDPLPEGSK
jgi:hypothetical protein